LNSSQSRLSIRTASMVLSEPFAGMSLQFLDWYFWHLGGLRTRRVENFSSAELDEISWLASYAKSQIIEKRVIQNEEGLPVPLSRNFRKNERIHHLQGPLAQLARLRLRERRRSFAVRLGLFALFGAFSEMRERPLPFSAALSASPTPPLS